MDKIVLKNYFYMIGSFTAKYSDYLEAQRKWIGNICIFTPYEK